MRKVVLMTLATLFVGASAMAVPAKKSTGQKAIVTPAVHAIPQSGVLDATDLIAIARLKSKTATDQFSDDPTLAFVGRQFTITLGSKDLSTDYDKDSHRLTVSTPSYSSYFALAEEVTVSRYTGQNSYGASAVVSKQRGNSFGVWIPGESYNRKQFKYSADLDGPAARELSKSLRLRLSGTVTRANGIWADKDSAIYEKARISEATVSDPYDVFVQGFYVSVAFTKAEWIDERSSSVLATDMGSN